MNNKENRFPSINTTLDQHAPGAKLDADKPDCNLVFKGFSRGLIEVSKLGTFGAIKYSKNGWLEVEEGTSRYSSAMLRHYFLESKEFYDKETSLPHAVAVAWNALARLELILEDEEDSLSHLAEGVKQ